MPTLAIYKAYIYIGTVGLEKHPQLSPTHAAVFLLRLQQGLGRFYGTDSSI
jgi:hypothetical protein